MQRFSLLSFITAGLLFLATDAARAQYYGRGAYSPFGGAYGGYGGVAGIGGHGYGGIGSPYGPPLLSPYLNLLRGGDPAANYFLGVVPEMQRRDYNALFSNAIGQLDRRLYQPNEGDEVPELTTTTGHPTAFMNTGSYFGSMNAPRTVAPAGRRPR
jgi:hypothetical protein